MKSVLISIQPKWCDMIAGCEKTIEIRKTRPKLEPPFKVYIYRTKGVVKHIINGKWENMNVGGTVIGEFVCDKILDICIEVSKTDDLPGYPFPCTGLTDVEIMQYLGIGKPGYGWHISNLRIYDEPKPLRDFNKPCPYRLPDGSRMNVPCPCDKYTWGFDEQKGLAYCLRKMNRPPQSWCYVEEVSDNA